MARQLYLDQNYLSAIVKRKPAFAELEVTLRRAVARGVVAVVESAVHERESRPRPDLGLLELLRDLSAARRLPSTPAPAVAGTRARLALTITREFPVRAGRATASSSTPGAGPTCCTCVTPRAARARWPVVPDRVGVRAGPCQASWFADHSLWLRRIGGKARTEDRTRRR